MQLTINIPNEQLKPVTEKKKEGLDFSSFKVDSFKELDGLEYQKKIRNEW